MKIILVLLLSIFSFLSFSQLSNYADTAFTIPLVRLGYGVNLPAADMSHRFGMCSSVDGAFFVKYSKNIVYGLSTKFFFGNNVKDTMMLENLKTSEGLILNKEGKSADVTLFERGFSVSSHFGKVFPTGKNKNSGVLALGGIGFLQHKIKIVDPLHFTPQINKEIVKGYDRLSNGISLNQYIGYQHISNNNLLNFSIGFEIEEGFTKNRRTINYDTGKADNTNRIDIMYGVRINWLIPIYKKTPKEYYYY